MYSIVYTKLSFSLLQSLRKLSSYMMYSIKVYSKACVNIFVYIKTVNSILCKLFWHNV